MTRVDNKEILVNHNSLFIKLLDSKKSYIKAMNQNNVPQTDWTKNCLNLIILLQSNTAYILASELTH